MAHEMINDLKLEQYRLGELPSQEMAEMKAALQTDPTLQTRLAALDASDQEILARYPVETMTEQIRQRREGKATQPHRRQRSLLGQAWKAIPLLAAAWLVSILIIPVNEPSPEIQEPDITLTKGLHRKENSPRLALFHKLNGTIVTELEPDSRLTAGDLLQIAFSPGKARYGVILSIDGRGTVTLHHPPSESDRNALLPSSKLVLLTNAYELDDAPDFERFYFITANQPFSTTELLQKIRDIAKQREPLPTALPIDDSYQQTSLTVRK